MHVLSPTQADTRLRNLRGWTRDGSTIARTFTFRKFLEGVAFVNEVARIAEHFDHHPDIDLRYKQVVVRYTTWEEGGLTEKDFEMAARVDRLASGEEPDEAETA